MTLRYLREHRSRFGHSACLHELTDAQGRALSFWAKAPQGELGDQGRLRGLVTRHLVEFGRARTELSQARFTLGDPYASAPGDELGAALGAAAAGALAHPEPTPAPRRERRPRPGGRPPLELDDPPEAAPSPPASLRARFSRLDLDDE